MTTDQLRAHYDGIVIDDAAVDRVARAVASAPQRPARRHAGPAVAAAAMITACVASLGLLVAHRSAAGHGPAAGNGATGTSYHFTTATPLGALIPPDRRALAQDVEGSLLSGGRFRLSQHLGRVVVLNYWASWCGPCQQPTGGLVGLAHSSVVGSADVVGVDVGDHARTAAGELHSLGVDVPVVSDPTAATLGQLGGIPSHGLPIVVLIDRDARVAAVYLGLAPTAQLVRVVDELTRGS